MVKEKKKKSFRNFIFLENKEGLLVVLRLKISVNIFTVKFSSKQILNRFSQFR